MSTHTAQALWPHRPNHLHLLHTHELTHKHKHKHTCSERLGGGGLPSSCPQSLVDRDSNKDAKWIHLPKPNPMPSGHGKGTHVCSGPSIQEPESPCASPDIYPSRKNDPSWTAGHTDNNHSTDENCSVRADYPQGTMLCQDQCRTGGCLPLGRSSRISCVSSCRKLLIKKSPNQKPIPHRRDDSENVCLYTHP